jgi:hypothetical protein
MLPDVEINTLVMTVDDTVGFAVEGKLVDGYTVLQAGLERAEDDKVAGELWADELIGRYRMALENYCASYGVPLE